MQQVNTDSDVGV